MTRGRTYAVYVRDDGVTSYARLVDSDELMEASRGWDTAGVTGMSLVPRGARPRIAYGISATTGRKGIAVVATPTADLWTGVATTFDVEGNDGAPDTMTVIQRRQERFTEPH